ncbi:FAD binding domain-containing protein [Streptomyces fulvorobeus]|uniref:FAD-binding molybdopterin dehydrogenase n=1 Tax=Streptomyces fulvorobeus TaxID=284028 RepID=A0A7J0CFD6_9ACTN|nr:xanthine dehydrogenase family protein subunit M [Streptomyces fulvorobeus]NYE44638.1 xanthine dehydrogenase YagS FAD-binding subunit [Streptomyces fulvorobeus]GFN01186.1 FAD-binding molybdopterin dehydrogenase [Streptomyces fulvorobeus]
MKPFAYQRADSIDDAISAIANHPGTAYLAGGTNLVDLMKLGVSRPRALVDISHLPLDHLTHRDGHTVIGALATNATVAADPVIRTDFPVLSESILAGASGQLRNSASTAGNLLQKTRCTYFQDVSKPCNKRAPGSGCPARTGAHRDLGILGVSTSCIATQPSDMAVALSVLDATVSLRSAAGERTVKLQDFYVAPGTTPHRETVLEHGELLTQVAFPALPAGATSRYRKVRDRWSYAFAVISVAAVVVLDAHGRIEQVRIAWGGVAPRPWRAYLAEAELRGRRPSPELFERTLRAELRHATPLPQNEFKVDLVKDVTTALLTDLAHPAEDRKVTR